MLWEGPGRFRHFVAEIGLRQKRAFVPFKLGNDFFYYEDYVEVKILRKYECKQHIWFVVPIWGLKGFR